MSTLNVPDRELSIKIVYYGPGLGGKTSSLQYIHRALKPETRGQLVSLATGTDRTLFFDFLPVQLPKMRGYTIRVQLYTVPGQVHYNATRKLVLSGADGVVFVADSQRDRQAATVESLENLTDNLRDQGLSVETIPLVLQFNKRDLADVVPVADMQAQLNRLKRPAFETVAMTGRGILEALKAITGEVLRDLRRRGEWDPDADMPAAPAPGPAAAAAPGPAAPARGPAAPAAHTRDAAAPARAPAATPAPTGRDPAAPEPLTGSLLSDRILEVARQEGAPVREPGRREDSGPREFGRREDSRVRELGRREDTPSREFGRKEDSRTRELSRKEDSRLRELSRKEESRLREFGRKEDTPSRELGRKEDSGSDRVLELSRLEDARPDRVLSNLDKLTLLEPGAGILAELVPPGPRRDQIAALEAEISRCDYAAAIRRAGVVLSEVTRELAAVDPEAGPALVALLHQVPPQRYLRIRDLLRRVDTSAVSSEDAALALLFVVDLLVRRPNT